MNAPANNRLMTKRGKATVTRERDYFTVEHLTRMAGDLKSGRIPLKKQTVTDPMTVGLQAQMRNTGMISFHVIYHWEDGERPNFKIGVFDPGHPEHLDIPEARNIARTIQHLSENGVDVRDYRLKVISQIRKQGVKWRP